MAQVVECLPSKCKALNSITNTEEEDILETGTKNMGSCQLKAVKEVTSNKTENLPIIAMQKVQARGKRAPHRDNRPFPPFFISTCK
jgi:hypothetical protein